MPTSPDCIVAPVEHLSYNVGSAPTAAESDHAVWQWLRFPCVTEHFALLASFLGNTSPPKRGGNNRGSLSAQFVIEPQLDANCSAPRSETARIV